MSGWTAAGSRPPADAARPTPAAGPPAATYCTITDRRVTESSGLAAGGDLLYTVNDGGDRIRVFELDRGCRVRRVIENPTDPYDVEDLARAPDGTLWLADIGDNAAVRRTVALERLDGSGAVSLYRFTYPDGPHDAEALLLDPRGRPYIVTKQPLTAGVYTPAGAASTAHATPLRRVATLTFLPTGTRGGPVGPASQVLVTGGAVAPDGSRVVLRTYTDAYLWPLRNGDVAAALRSAERRRIPLPATPQGEAVSFAPDGRSLLTSTEGVPSPVHAVPLDSGDPPPAGPAPAGTGSAGTGSATPPAASRPAIPGHTGSPVGTAVTAALIAAGLVWLAGRVRRRRRP